VAIDWNQNHVEFFSIICLYTYPSNMAVRLCNSLKQLRRPLQWCVLLGYSCLISAGICEIDVWTSPH